MQLPMTSLANAHIGTKLFLAILFTSGLCVGAMALLQSLSFKTTFLGYIQEVELDRVEALSVSLVNRYRDEGDWTFIQGKERWPAEFMRRHPRASQRDLASRDDRLAAAGAKSDSSAILMPRARVGTRNRLWARVGLISTDGRWIAGRMTSTESARRALYSGNDVIGYLVLESTGVIDNKLDQRFATQQARLIAIAALIAIVGATIAAALLARNFSGRINGLAQGTRRLTEGHFETRLNQSQQDELGQLADDFNSLAFELDQNRRSRQQWVDDISHELRTPITILQVELESVRDGLRPLNQGALQSFSAEVGRLSVLIEDLHQLSQFDAGKVSYNLELTDVPSLIKDVVLSFKERSRSENLSIEYDYKSLPSNVVDSVRLRQLFVNLLENSVRYTDSGGIIKVTVDTIDDELRVTVEDSAPQVPADALPHLFERLYRVDKSRSRETGASGLGLAICERIVVDHGGTISARHSSIGGLCITVCLPLDTGGPD